MKKILILLLLVIFFISCSKSTYTLAPRPNNPFTQKTLEGKKIKPENLVGLYVSFPQPATFYKDSRKDQIQEVSGGVLYVENLITGASLYQPQTVPVRYDNGSKQGEIVKGPLRTERITLASGQFLTEDFLAPIVGVVPDDEYVGEVLVEIKSDSLGDTFSYVPIPVYPESRYGMRNDRNISQNNGFSPFKNREYFKKERDNASVKTKAPIDYRYTIKLLSFKEDMELDTQFSVEPSTNLVFFEESGVRYYVTQGKSGSFWFLADSSKFLYIDKFYLVETTNNQKTQSEAESKKIGRQ